MNFLEAVRMSRDNYCYMRRPSWQDGVAMYIDHANGNDGTGKFMKESQGNPYVATCHIAACELAGVRTVEDVLADDWEVY